jgi:pSer/pThr/pTyr-binding forkhead associated (FHA) protein
MDNYQLLLYLRIGLVAILYLVILQIVLVSRRDLRQAEKPATASISTRARQVVGRLILIDSGSTQYKPGQQFDLEPITTLGRAPTNSIVLESSFVSTEHTRILYRDRSLWVEDMGSRNGTLVNQQTITQPVAVSPGTILQVGDVRFEFAAA